MEDQHESMGSYLRLDGGLRTHRASITAENQVGPVPHIYLLAVVLAF